MHSAEVPEADGGSVGVLEQGFFHQRERVVAGREIEATGSRVNRADGVLDLSQQVPAGAGTAPFTSPHQTIEGSRRVAFHGLGQTRQVPGLRLDDS